MFTAIPDDLRQIRATAASLRSLLVDNGLPTGRWFASIRWSLARQLLRHVAMRTVAPHDRAADDVERQYRRHLAEWTPAMIDAEWPLHCRERRAMLDSLEHDLDEAPPCAAAKPGTR